LRNHPHLFVRHAHDGGRLVAHAVGALRAGAQRVAVLGRVVFTGGAARLERGHHHALVDDPHARNVRCVLDDLRDLAFVVFARDHTRPVDTEIARRLRVQLRFSFHRRVEVDHRRELLVRDLHEVGGLLRGGAALGDHHRDQIADMHRFFRQHRAERHRHLDAATAHDRRVARDAADAGGLHVGGGQHRQHARRFTRLVRLHRHDAGMRMRRAHEGGIGLVLQARIVHETAAAADEGVVLDARREFGKAAGCHARSRMWSAGALL
jgi:hypothetical protein